MVFCLSVLELRVNEFCALCAALIKYIILLFHYGLSFLFGYINKINISLTGRNMNTTNRPTDRRNCPNNHYITFCVTITFSLPLSPFACFSKEKKATDFTRSPNNDELLSLYNNNHHRFRHYRPMILFNHHRLKYQKKKNNKITMSTTKSFTSYTNSFS